jgi:hypothetical protein
MPGRVETADTHAVRTRRLWGPASRGPRRSKIHALGLASPGPPRPSQCGPAVGTRPGVSASSSQHDVSLEEAGGERDESPALRDS